MSHNVIGKFRDAAFIVTSEDLEFGRRNVVHEYPSRDEPYVEDLGKKARKYNIQVSVMGAGWQEARDKLLDAIELPGDGTLLHPKYGSMVVSIIDARMSESSRSHGKATFTLTYVEAEAKPRYPNSTYDTASGVNKQADKSIADSINDFASVFDVLGQAQSYVDDITKELGDILGAVENVTGAATVPIASLIRTPFNMAVAIAGSFSRVQTLLDEPGNALNLYKGVFEKEEPTYPSTTTPQGRQAATSKQALVTLTKRIAIGEGAKTAATTNFATSNDALRIQQELADALDQQIEQENIVDGSPIADEMYFSLAELRVALITDLRTRAAQLPKIKTHTPLTTLPALVIAHNVYGDATREAELVTRNKIAHAGFVQGGQALEVLTDV